MNAIRQIIEVKDHQLNISLPQDFNADKVEIIILPADDTDFELTEEEKELIRQRVKNTLPENLKSWDKIKEKYL
ncbi:hypothetical protein [Chryseobacterium fistulae]|jgi:hypothetical protein|uniref:Uncharacterized protein n=1 Tax=Chryseobacterium fistulae TaxID=2675058 RepID=A0A6N4XUA4_9FLAO|nr:hypothetical protein [Chryseobacterium fistulae]CAA7392430.1 hypothetical protein CHRY9393_03150 [Chryseobacterium fistulae]